MRVVRLCASALLVAISLPSFHCGAATQEVNLEAARKVFESKCSKCHDLDRPLKKTKTAEGWRKTIARMRSHSQGAITEADAQMILEYLRQVRGPKP